MAPEIVVYGSACPACTQAKAVLDRFGLAYAELPLSVLREREPRLRTMPQITVDGELLGGINELLRLARSGGLEHLAGDTNESWIDVKRRVGRGYDVVVRDRLGRAQSRARTASREDADRLVSELRNTWPPPTSNPRA